MRQRGAEMRSGDQKRQKARSGGMSHKKDQELKGRAYGFRDSEFFKLRLAHLHAQEYSLTG